MTSAAVSSLGSALAVGLEGLDAMGAQGCSATQRWPPQVASADQSPGAHGCGEGAKDSAPGPCGAARCCPITVPAAAGPDPASLGGGSRPLPGGAALASSRPSYCAPGAWPGQRRGPRTWSWAIYTGLQQLHPTLKGSTFWQPKRLPSTHPGLWLPTRALPAGGCFPDRW